MPRVSGAADGRTAVTPPWTLPEILRAVWPESPPEAVCAWCKAKVWRLRSLADRTETKPATEVCDNCYVHWWWTQRHEALRRRTCAACGHFREFHAHPTAGYRTCAGASGCTCFTYAAPVLTPVVLPGGVATWL